MVKHLYENSYVVAIVTFVILLILCYVFDIGTQYRVNDKNQLQKSFNWKYPLALSLLVWVSWHFFVFPQSKDEPSTLSIMKNNLNAQKMFVNTWN